MCGLRRDPYWPFDKPFDSRATPDEWLSWSAGQPPEQTLDELRRWSGEEAPALLERMDGGDQDIVVGPYGPIPWTVLSLHVLWDGWLHERDVVAVTGGGSPSKHLEDAAVAAYALFIASMVALLQNQPLDVSVALGSNDRHFFAVVRPGHVELRTVASPASADLHGTLDVVVDSLAGRGPLLADLLAGDPAKREPLTLLRPMLAPRDPPPDCETEP